MPRETNPNRLIAQRIKNLEFGGKRLCLRTLEEHLPTRLKVTNIHFLCFPQAIKLKGIALVHLSPTPGAIFLPSSLLSCLPLSIPLLRLMRMLSTGSPVSPLSFFFLFQTPWLKFARSQNVAKTVGSSLQDSGRR